ncbi:MAG: glycerol-3-phosphate dehydrogenase C-terminal domain-containing protein [Minwuia sp.]|nr:glycerol-3-phosphate dehydrogenase C-terminal domain-containing protein [Minwuia sp.]
MGDPGTAGELHGPGLTNAFRAWQAARNGAPLIWHVDGDLVDGPGLPQGDDVLVVAGPAGEAACATLLQRLAPHLVRQVRLARPDAASTGLFGRLLGKGKASGDRVAATDAPLNRILKPLQGHHALDQALVVDVPRLIIALARDSVAHGGQIVRGKGSAGSGDMSGKGTGSIIVTRRPWPEEIGFHDPKDPASLTVLPLGNGFMAAISDSADTSGTLQQLAGMIVAQPDAPAATASAGHAAAVRALIDADLPLLDGLDPLKDGQLSGGYGMFANRLAATWAHLDAAYIRMLMTRHGSATPEVLDQVHREDDLGEDFGGGLRAREVRWMVEHEWARKAEDVFFRRGPFQYSGTDFARLQDWMDRHGPVV